MAASSVRPERHQPGQSTAEANTFLVPISRTTGNVFTMELILPSGPMPTGRPAEVQTWNDPWVLACARTSWTSWPNPGVAVAASYSPTTVASGPTCRSQDRQRLADSHLTSPITTQSLDHLPSRVPATLSTDAGRRNGKF